MSIGSFRISKDYIKNFRKDYKNSSAAYFPYEIRAGYYQYPEDLRVEMEEFLYENLINTFTPVEEFSDDWCEPCRGECIREIIKLCSGK